MTKFQVNYDRRMVEKGYIQSYVNEDGKFPFTNYRRVIHRPTPKVQGS